MNIPLYRVPVTHIEQPKDVWFFDRPYVVPGAVAKRATIVAIAGLLV